MRCRAALRSGVVRIGMLTGGGDCPGLNAVIRAVVRTAVFRYQADVVGIGQGFEGLVRPELIGKAREMGLRHLSCMPIAELEKDAIQTLTDLGFEKFSIPGYGADPDGRAYDMVKLVLKL